MRKRVGLARALIMNPELILYDEPTTGLDPIMSDVINELMIRTRRNHPVTSVIVTHDMLTARKVADRVVMLYPVARLEPDEPQILFRRAAQCARPLRGSPGAAVRARRSGRAIDGNAEAPPQCWLQADPDAQRTANLMDERVIQFRVGVVVVASAIITVILVMLFGAGPTSGSGVTRSTSSFRKRPASPWTRRSGRAAC